MIREVEVVCKIELSIRELWNVVLKGERLF